MIYLNNTSHCIIPFLSPFKWLAMWGCSFTLLCTVILCILFPVGILCNVLLVVFRDCVCKCNTHSMKKNALFNSSRRSEVLKNRQVQFTHHCSDISGWTRWCFPGRSRTHQDGLPSCWCRWPCRSLQPGWCLHINEPFPTESEEWWIKDM